jgi:hypothetical protein
MKPKNRTIYTQFYIKLINSYFRKRQSELIKKWFKVISFTKLLEKGKDTKNSWPLCGGDYSPVGGMMSELDLCIRAGLVKNSTELGYVAEDIIEKNLYQSYAIGQVVETAFNLNDPNLEVYLIIFKFIQRIKESSKKDQKWKNWLSVFNLKITKFTDELEVLITSEGSALQVKWLLEDKLIQKDKQFIYKLFEILLVVCEKTNNINYLNDGYEACWHCFSKEERKSLESKIQECKKKIRKNN